MRALDDAVVAVMIEKAPAVENLEALRSVKGVDVVQVGPADSSMSVLFDRLKSEGRALRDLLGAG